MYLKEEKLAVKCNIINNSPATVTRVRFRLHRSVALRWHGETDTNNTPIHVVDQPASIAPGQRQSIDVVLPVPAGVLHSFLGNLVTCQYSVRCSVNGGAEVQMPV